MSERRVVYWGEERERLAAWIETAFARDAHPDDKARIQRIARLLREPVNARLLEAAKNAAHQMKRGWIAPEGETADYEEGWTDACKEYADSGALKDLLTAIAAASREETP